MPLNQEDSAVEAAERAASPERFGVSSNDVPPPRQEAIEEVESLSSAASSRSGSPVSTAARRPQRSRGASASTGTGVSIARLPTARDDLAGLHRHPTALSRIETHRSQHASTVGAGLRSRTSTRQTKPLPNFGAGKPYPPLLPEREEYVVEFDGPDDPMHAQNWPSEKKLRTGAVLGWVTLCAAFTSSIFSAATMAVAAEFGLSSTVSTLGTSLYVLGFATGPIVFAPLSELYGRRLPLLGSSFMFCIFAIATAVAKDAQTVLISRFFAGFAGACPLTVVGAVFADMYNNQQRGIAITVFSVCVFSGPLLAPFVGGFITMSYLGWRWTMYIAAIMGFLGLGLSIFFLEETYAPLILVNKASELRRRTKNWGIHAKQEEIEVDLRELLEKNLSRPMRMLFTEPIVLFISIYMAFIYGLLYLMLTFYPIIFQRVHGMNLGVGSLPLLGMVMGEVLAAIYMLIIQPGYVKKLAKNNNMPIPEWRLPPVIIGGSAFSVGILWLGWTGFTTNIHWIVPTLSGLCTGFGIMSVFLNLLNYLIDAYLMFAASAIAANTFLRSIFGAVFPLFATQLIDALGIQYTGTLLGGIAILMIPVPVLLYLKGAKIRQKSKFAPSFPLAAQASHHGPHGAGGSDDEGGDLEKAGAKES